MFEFIMKAFKIFKKDSRLSIEEYFETDVNIRLKWATEHKDKDLLIGLYECLFTKDIDKFRKVLNLIVEITDNLKIEEYKYLDSNFRKRSSLNYNVDWKDMDSQVFIKDVMSDKEKVIIFGLSSFHPNGYFREKSLVELKKYNTGEELKFFILRSNDWVDKIRELAEKEVINRIEISRIVEIIEILPLIYRTKSWRKCNSEAIEKKIKELFKHSNCTDIILPQLASKNFFIKKLCYETLLSIDFDSAKLTKLAIKETSPELRYLIYKSLLNKKENIEIFLEDDKYYKIRLEWLKNLETKDYLQNKEKILEKLFDKNEFIRETARKIIDKNEKIDFKDFYVQHLKLRLKESLTGVYDLAVEEDKKIFEKYLEHENIHMKIIALKGLAKTNFYEYIEIYLKSLKSVNREISLQAKKVLETNILYINDKHIYEIYKSSLNDLIKENCVKLLVKTKKWISLKYILEFLDSDNPEIRKIAEFKLERWIKYFNNDYSKFEDNVEEYIQMINNSKNIDEKTKYWLLFSFK